MKKYSILFYFLILAASTNAQQKVSWNGYLQYRFSDNYLDQTSFSVRRAKFWIIGLLPSESESWSYKLQANFLQQVKFQFLLQDVLVGYKRDNIEVTAGQFVPDFSMQRKQPDYAIPLDERADVVNALVPGAETMARDIGVEVKLSDSKKFSFSMGLFNGNGANNVTSQRNFLFTNRGTLQVLNSSKLKLSLGYNLSYRDAHKLQFSKIFGSAVSFTGKDFRFGFEGRINLGELELQSEYIESHLGSRKAYGYYALADYLITSSDLLVLSIEQLNDLNPLTSDLPFYLVGYSRLIKGNDIKISLDNKFQFESDRTNTLTTLQVQYFFN
ncbi:MAG TPA: porin [Ignavibacteriales bacterium]|nr:porin [Ignavibacteriales bacterium]